jgi:membrane fusion protein, multidrug efflux system
MTKKVKVEIAFDNVDKKLIPETFIDITIPIDGTGRSEFTEGRFFVPLKAVTITQTENFVFLNKENIAIKTSVEIGETLGDKVEIMVGLSNDDELIIEGNRGLEGDEKVQISN